MKRFFNLVITNMANVIKPMIILAVITVVVQVFIYNFNLVTGENYKKNSYEMDLEDQEDVICASPVEFMTEENELIYYAIMLITINVGVGLIGHKIREKDEKISVFRMLPVKRSTLFFANLVAKLIPAVGIYIINLACVAIFYLIYMAQVPYKFREGKIDRIDGTDIGLMLWYLFVCIAVAVIAAVIHSKKAYAIRGKKRGGNDE